MFDSLIMIASSIVRQASKIKNWTVCPPAFPWARTSMARISTTKISTAGTAAAAVCTAGVPSAGVILRGFRTSHERTAERQSRPPRLFNEEFLGSSSQVTRIADRIGCNQATAHHHTVQERVGLLF